MSEHICIVHGLYSGRFGGGSCTKLKVLSVFAYMCLCVLHICLLLTVHCHDSGCESKWYYGSICLHDGMSVCLPEFKRQCACVCVCCVCDPYSGITGCWVVLSVDSVVSFGPAAPSNALWSDEIWQTGTVLSRALPHPIVPPIMARLLQGHQELRHTLTSDSALADMPIYQSYETLSFLKTFTQDCILRNILFQ